MANKKYLLALGAFKNFGPVRLRRLKDFFGDWRNAFSASQTDLEKAGLEPAVAAEFVSKRASLDPDSVAVRLEKENIKTLTLEDEGYPPLLKQIYDPPFILYYRGDLSSLGPTLAIVGSRKCTPYGQRLIESFIPPLVRNKITISSGLALGIDSLAQAKTAAEGGRTIAVLGSGLNDLYPPQNRLLADRIIAGGGAVISEFPLGTPPLRGNFPQRNRIIAGLAEGTLIIEAGLKSGSLITARFATESGREVFAVPGSVFSPASAGTNDLIRQGATPVSAIEDVLEFFGISLDKPAERTKKDWSGMTEVEREILVNLSNEPLHIDELARLTRLDTKIINSTLSILEIKMIIKNVGGNNYITLN